MTLPAPEPTPISHAAPAISWKIELKVIASTAAAFAVSIVVAVLNVVQDNHALLGSISSPLQFILLAAIPTAVTFMSGFLAKHTSREPSGG